MGRRALGTRATRAPAVPRGAAAGRLGADIVAAAERRQKRARHAPPTAASRRRAAPAGSAASDAHRAVDALGPVGPAFAPPPPLPIPAPSPPAAGADPPTPPQLAFSRASAAYNTPVLARRSRHAHIPLRAGEAAADIAGRAAVPVTVDWLDGSLWVVSLDAQYGSHIYHASTRILALFDAQVRPEAERSEASRGTHLHPDARPRPRSAPTRLPADATFPHGSPSDGYLAPLDEANFPQVRLWLARNLSCEH